jgi:hypothetical protein
MQTVSLPLDRLRSLILAADARLGTIDYVNDHIWEINQTSTDPGGFNLQTSFGLRARSYRIFPRFQEGNTRISDPREYESRPVIQQLAPNYALITFAPFAGLDITCEVWVPNSHAVVCRYTFRNNGVTTRNLGFSLCALLSPDLEGHRMIPEQIQGSAVLSGETSELFPLVFMTGGVEIDQGPLPGLEFRMNLLPGTQYQSTMIQTAEKSKSDSFDQARRLAACNWDAEITRINLVNADRVEIETGNQEWNQIFALGQQTALRLIIGPCDQLPEPTFVLGRSPDHGFSPRQDGSDYTYLWNGVTPLQTAYLVGMLLPADSEYALQFVRNFLKVQDPDSGFIDWKPGHAGQRSRILATPILASLAWEMFEMTGKRTFLEEVYEPLSQFVSAWFELRNDQDADGVPECDHPAQLGFEDHPFYGNAGPAAQGVDISATEQPGLCALLYQECRALIKIAEKLGQIEKVPELAVYAETLRLAVEGSWDEANQQYLPWDRDTHHSTAGEKLGQHEGNGSLPIRYRFDHPTRLVLQIKSSSGLPPRPQVTVYGQDQNANTVERILLPERWQWFLEVGSVTTNDMYLYLDSVKIQGLEPADELSVSTINFKAGDMSCFFPVYARMCQPARAAMMIENTITDPQRYWMPFGLPAFAAIPEKTQPAAAAPVILHWNVLAGATLLAYGYRARAAELFSHLMSGILTAFRQNGVFTARISALDGSGSGEINTLDGLPPLGMFFATLGVKIYSPWKIHLEGQNPFPWPVKLRYRGLTVDRRNDKTVITFPDSQSVTIADPAPCMVTAS